MFISPSFKPFFGSFTTSVQKIKLVSATFICRLNLSWLWCAGGQVTAGIKGYKFSKSILGFENAPLSEVFH